ncbi:Alkaline extracellular protease [Yarrowia sp. C11]|nr:Alkaline extracellular protease [Yarrowia sp. C11]KAG5364144.1 Alkaline extracellular protease [Yarrowia sp. E02]
MKLSLLLLSTLAVALPIAKQPASEYNQLLDLISNQDLEKRDVSGQPTIVMFTDNSTITDKLAHVKAIIGNDHIEKLYDVSSTEKGAGVAGYIGTFSNETLALIAEAGCISIFQEDSIVQGLGFEETLVERDETLFNTESGQPWHLGRISHLKNPVNTPQASEYAYRSGSLDTNIYVVDSGVRTSHVAFGGRAHWGANFNNDIDEDEHGHGTAVASIAAGISKNAQIYSVKVLGAQNTGSLSGILSGLEWAINHASSQNGRSVINMSIGSDATEVYKTLIQKALEKNIALFFAAGNNNEDACTVSPARFAKDFTGVFTVGASDQNDNQLDWSGYGNCVSLVAPGVGIASASRRGDDVYTSWKGTSMGAPIVAGIASYWLSILPLNMASLEWFLTQSRGEVNTHGNTPNVLAWNFHY